MLRGKQTVQLWIRFGFGDILWNSRLLKNCGKYFQEGKYDTT